LPQDAEREPPPVLESRQFRSLMHGDKVAQISRSVEKKRSRPPAKGGGPAVFYNEFV
jgi:hypothetical protein